MRGNIIVLLGHKTEFPERIMCCFWGKFWTKFHQVFKTDKCPRKLQPGKAGGENTAPRGNHSQMFYLLMYCCYLCYCFRLDDRPKRFLFILPVINFMLQFCYNSCALIIVILLLMRQYYNRTFILLTFSMATHCRVFFVCVTDVLCFSFSCKI